MLFTLGFFVSLVLHQFVFFFSCFCLCSAQLFAPLIFGVAFSDAVSVHYRCRCNALKCSLCCDLACHKYKLKYSCSYFIPTNYQENENDDDDNNSNNNYKYQRIPSHRKCERKTMHEIETKHKRSRVHRQNWILKRLTSLIRTPTTFSTVFFFCLHCFPIFYFFSFSFFISPIVFLSFCPCRRALCVPHCNKCHGFFYSPLVASSLRSHFSILPIGPGCGSLPEVIPVSFICSVFNFRLALSVRLYHKTVWFAWYFRCFEPWFSCSLFCMSSMVYVIRSRSLFRAIDFADCQSKASTRSCWSCFSCACSLVFRMLWQYQARTHPLYGHNGGCCYILLWYFWERAFISTV